MAIELIGRYAERAKIDKLLNSPTSEFMAVYGRRRVGKTFLIREYLKSNIVFSFTGAFDGDNKTQLENFFTEYLYQTKKKNQTKRPLNWNEAFNQLADYLYKLKNRKKKLVVFIDELPWLDRPKSGFISALEYFWNKHVSAMDNVLLIVCGSAASWMKKKLIEARGGLHNRITARIKLMPFNLYETESFCKKRHLKFTRYQIVLLYMVMGGIPFYLNELSKGKSAEQLIDEICFSPLGLLSGEYKQLYYSLFKNAGNHVRIVEALAEKPNGMVRNDLIAKVGLSDGGTFVRALDDLIESGFVSITRPFNKKKKDSLYRLADLYSLFYLKFIKGNISEMPHTWQKISGQSSFKAWSGYAFENICLMHIPQILSSLGLSGTYTEVSSWKHIGNKELQGAQIDFLINRKDGVINLCEAKFTKEEFVITKKYSSDLQRKSMVFKHVTRTRNVVVNTLVTTYPALQNEYYLQDIHSEVQMDDLFQNVK